MKIFAPTLLAVSVALTGCTSMGQLDGVTTVADDESIFMLGVAPENFRVSVFPGSVKGKYFVQSLLRPAAVYGGAKDGFVVGKAKAGDILAIMMVSVHADGSSIVGARFEPCGSSKTMVFEVPAGKVLYLGHVDYAFEGQTLAVKYRSDIDAARQHFAARFSPMKATVQPLNYQLLEAGRVDCGSSAITPVYR